MIDFTFLITSKILSYTECERIDIEEAERLEKAARMMWG